MGSLGPTWVSTWPTCRTDISRREGLEPKRMARVYTTGALTGAVTTPVAVSALSISSIVRPRVSKPMNSAATIPRMDQAAK